MVTQTGERIELRVARRQVLGKKVRQLRRQGITPANVYGRHVESVAVQVPTQEVLHLLRRVGTHEIVYLLLDGEEERPAFIRHVQRDPITGELLHLDFQQVSLTEQVRLEVPLHLVGTAPVVGDYGATVLQSLDYVMVEGLPTAIPSFIEVDLSALREPGSAIFVRDLAVPPGVTILTDGEMEVVRAVVEAAAEEEVEAAEAAEAEEAEEEEE
jgi:large subunit ribosomal protein L25